MIRRGREDDGRSVTAAGAPMRAAPDPAAAPDVDSEVARLFRSHRLSMVRLAVLLVDDLETAEDLTQDAYAQLHRNWHQLHNADAAVGYLRICVVNGARSVLRRRRTVRRTSVPSDGRTTVDGAEAAVLLADEHRRVLAAVNRLPHRQREVIVLRYWTQLTEAEIASTLGISVGSVKSAASRGRDAVAAALEAQQ
jgi:RNA polymerase sigma-70 factor (sigma-E family)